MEQQELIPHLFRSEYSKIVAVLCRHFGFNQIEMAEDIASDTFLTAAQPHLITCSLVKLICLYKISTTASCK